MKRTILLLLVSLGFYSNDSFAQLQLSTNQILFNTINETQLDSSNIIIYNHSEKEISVKDFVFFKTYKSNSFFVKNFSKTTIPGGDSISVYIYFQPKHNIYHNSELLILTEPNVYSKTVDLQAQGKYSLTYYANTENKSEEELKAILKAQLASGYVSLGYNVARDNMFMTIDNQKTNGQGASVNTLECIYTGKKALAYTSRSQAQTESNFNTEHTFPQGFFSENEPMKSDLHHLFPTNDAANNSRGSYPFGVASTPYVNDAINTPSHLGSNNLYEPRDVQKGKTARAMMYFVLRYQDYSNFFAAQENILRTWHENFPPNAIDKKRNADIALLQKNRNPFIDYPEFADRITKLIGTSTAPILNSAKWIDTLYLGNIIDTSSQVEFYIPFVNNGNTNIHVNTFNSVDTSLHFENTDSLKINAGESAYEKVILHTKNKNGKYTSSVSFNTSFVQGANFVITYQIDSLKSGVSYVRDKNIKLYPNPAKETLHIESKENTSYVIYNQMGQLLIKGELKVGENNLNVNLLSPGLYFITTQTSSHYFIKE